MQYPIESFDKKISEEALVAFEKKLKVDSLPSDYRNFLLTSNGGYTKDNDAFTFYNESDGSGSQLNGLYGLNLPEDDYVNDIEWNFDEYSVNDKRIPDNFIFIGYDAGGNQICLGISGKHTGEIWFWDHEEEADDGEEPSMANMSLIAKTFTDFIEGLYEYKLEDDE